MTNNASSRVSRTSLVCHAKTSSQSVRWSQSFKRVAALLDCREGVRAGPILAFDDRCCKDRAPPLWLWDYIRNRVISTLDTWTAAGRGMPRLQVYVCGTKYWNRKNAKRAKS